MPDNSPAANLGTGTLTTLGMTNSYTNGAGSSGVASDDVLSTSGTANPNFTENLLRVRGTGNNGWADAAPEYSQGIQVDTSTVGDSNIVFSFNWYSTTQGIRDLEVQYNTNGNDGSGSSWVNYQGFVATSNDFYNSQNSPVNPTIYINLASIAAANNDPDLGIRLVSAYDSTGLIPGSNGYASAVGEVANPIDSASDSALSQGNSTATLTLANGVTAATYDVGNSIVVSGITPVGLRRHVPHHEHQYCQRYGELHDYWPGRPGERDVGVSAAQHHRHDSLQQQFWQLAFGDLTFATGTPTTTSVAAGPTGSANLGQSVTLTATVTGSVLPAFTGTVTYAQNGGGDITRGDDLTGRVSASRPASR